MELKLVWLPVLSIYYGTEVGMASGPIEGLWWPAASRKDMEWSKDPDILAHFKSLSTIRNNSEVIKHGDFQEMWVDDQVYAYGRNHPIVVMMFLLQVMAI